MGIKRRQYSKEQKKEIVQRALSGERNLVLGKERNISPGFINCIVSILTSTLSRSG